MADKKISALTGATTPLAGTEVLPIVQSGATVKVAVSDLTAGRAVSATQLTSTIAIGTAPLVVTSTTNVANLNASSLNGSTFAAPGAIGGGTAAAGNFTTLGASGAGTFGSGTQVTGAGLLKLGVATGNAGAAVQILGWSSPSYPNWQIDSAYTGVAGGLSFSPSTTGGGTTFTTPVMTLTGTGLNSTVIGATTPAAGSFTNVTLTTGNLIVASGQGIDFSATPNTGTSELLADYEEGTWTGTLTAVTTAPTTPVTATGTYTKIGRIVTVNINFDNKNTTGASGTMRINGLPYTPSGVFTGSAQLLGFTVVGTLNSYTSGAFIYFIGTGTTFTDVAIVAGTGKYVYATVVYEV